MDRAAYPAIKGANANASDPIYPSFWPKPTANGLPMRAPINRPSSPLKIIAKA